MIPKSDHAFFQMRKKMITRRQFNGNGRLEGYLALLSALKRRKWKSLTSWIPDLDFVETFSKTLVGL